jgi:hypothetical protein
VRILGRATRDPAVLLLRRGWPELEARTAKGESRPVQPASSLDCQLVANERRQNNPVLTISGQQQLLQMARFFGPSNTPRYAAARLLIRVSLVRIQRGPPVLSILCGTIAHAEALRPPDHSRSVLTVQDGLSGRSAHELYWWWPRRFATPGKSPRALLRRMPRSSSCRTSFVSR